MIKMSVMYPKGEGKTFDIDYYKTTHMPLAERTMGPVRWEVDHGLDGPYAAVGVLFFESMEALQKGMDNSAEALADLPNFTNIEPVSQVSQLVD